jgi:hypothetical protein
MDRTQLALEAIALVSVLAGFGAIVLSILLVQDLTRWCKRRRCSMSGLSFEKGT